MTTYDAFLTALEDERHNQRVKFPPKTMSLESMGHVLNEEAIEVLEAALDVVKGSGGVSRAINDIRLGKADKEHLKDEIIQTAACCLKFFELIEDGRA